MKHSSNQWHVIHEADIGSGEKTIAQRETEQMIEQVPRTPEQTAPTTHQSSTTESRSTSKPRT